jgi:predicted AlkP superfamily pyrophosphatase or phosphodiesterase
MAKLIICIDGLGRDMISKENAPFLHSFGGENYGAELETFFAFTGLEYSFFTGKTPRENKIWLEFIKSNKSLFKNWLLRIASINKKLRDCLAGIIQLKDGRTWISGLHNIPSDKAGFFDTCVKGGLWELDFFNNKEFAFYKWPFFVINGKRKLVFKYENDDERLMRLLSKKGCEVYYTQLMGVDKAVHKFGKKSNETKQAIKNLDRIIERYVGLFLKQNPGGEVFLWSDHGFADVKYYTDIKQILPKGNDYLYFIAGTTSSFWFKNKEVEKRVLNCLKQVKNIKFLDDKTAEGYQIPFGKGFDNRYGDLIFFVEKGNYFFPNFYQKSEKERFRAMHGYPNNKELNGFLISNKKIPKKLKISEVRKYLE